MGGGGGGMEGLPFHERLFLPGGVGGGLLLYFHIYIRRLGPFFGVQNFEYQYFWV